MLMEIKSTGARCCDNGMARGFAGWLSLAAAPTFGAMAVYTGLSDRPDMICSALPSSPPLNGMTVMYILMSLSHAVPWVALLSNRIVPSKAGLMSH
jgi:hypothetical protein